ncbi:hypothetical protein S40288_08979 [Stachybotrys chartarum IBT 40288]|nr:hypothetical protein S40288_08979 [Stachybotrys chartarum IBT 40288]
MVRSTLALSLLATASAAFATERPVLDNMSNQVPGAYIVEFEEGASASQFRTQAEPGYETRMALDFELFQGVSIQLNDVGTAEERAAQLASLPAVKNIWPVRMIDRPQPVTTRSGRGGALRDQRRPTRSSGRKALHKRQQGGNGTTPYQPHAMTGIDRLHAEGITGAGVTIAVIDTGIDYHHPSLGGCFGEGCLVAYGHDLVGDDYDGLNLYPDDDPDDTCDGHGTHVAGIIAAQGANPEGFTGAAPGVTLAAYRVFGCGIGSVGNDVLIAAFNMAFEQGADIITASIGGTSGWTEEPWAVAVSRIVERGVPCTLAAGNSGGAGLFFSSTAADGKGVTAVSSFDNPHIIETWNEAFYTVDDGESVAFPWDWSYPVGFDGVEREVWASSFDTDNTRDACEPLPDDTPDLGDFYVLFRESEECSVVDQAINLAAKGARFIVRYSFDNELWWYDVEFYEGTENILGAASITRQTGEDLIQALEAGSSVQAVFEYFEDAGTFTVRRWNTVNPGAVSTFTSWGPTFEMDFKPQFGAPGGDIFSTFPVEFDSWAVLSGTSMATPFAAAAYALVSQARGIKPEPRLLETLFASTARPQLWSWDNSFEDWLAPGAQQGAGLMQAYDAAFTTTRLEPSSLSFNDTANFAGTLNFTIINDGTDDVTFDISHVASHTLYTVDEDEVTVYYGIGEIIPRGAELSFSQSKVTVSAGSTATIQVTASAPEGLNENRYPYWSGFIAVNGTDDSGLSIPYQGISGSLYEADVMPTAYVADYADWDLNPIPANQSFVLPAPGDGFDWEDEDPSFPILMFRLEWGTKHLSIHVVPTTSCPPNSTYTIPGGFEAIGEIYDSPLEWMPRMGFQWGWIGEMAGGVYLPVGRYRLVFVAQRLFSDGTEDEDWIVRSSTPFHLSYLPPRSN